MVKIFLILRGFYYIDIMKKIINITVIAAMSSLMMFLSCNCEDKYPTITYEVGGYSSNTISIEFNNEYGEREKFPSIATRPPWIKEFKIENRGDEFYGGNLPGNIFPAFIEASLTRGELYVSIFVNGKLKATDTTTPQKRTASARYGVNF